MNHRKFFISQIMLLALPSILLSCFAIYAILGEKTFILKRIEETYTHLVASTQRNIVEKLREKEKLIQIKLDTFANKEIFLPENLDISETLYPHFFVIKENSIIYPQQRPQVFPRESSRIIENYDKLYQAHVYEFQKKDYQKAILEYKNISSEKNLEFLGFALEAIARCYLKSENYSNALDTYHNIINLFNDPMSLQEFKLIVNASFQIIETKKYQQNIVDAYEDLMLLLEFISFNELRIPKSLYNYYHSSISRYIEEIKDHTELNLEAKENLLTQYKKIVQLYEKKQKEEKLLVEYEIILDLLQKEKRRSGYILYEHKNVEQIIYYQNFVDGIVAYNIDIQELKNIIIPTIEVQAASNNDFIITLINQNEVPIINNSMDKNSYLITTKPIAETFPFWNVAIYAKHYNSLENLTLQKSYLYFGGIFFVIILLFMGIYIFISSFVREVRNSRLQSDFVSNVTHELKTPLTSIKMFVETLIMGRVSNDKEKWECLNIISSESDRLSRLIDRILDFAKMKENKRNFHFKKENIGKIIKEIISQFNQKALDCTVILKIEDNLPELDIDTEAINEAIVNLLSNAYKYTVKKQKEIRISCLRRGKYLDIKVKDNGIGIPKHEQKRVFQKFYRIEDHRHKKIEGTGLGLSLVSSIVSAHNGKISVNSRMNLGSEFTITLPINQTKQK